MSKFRSSLIFAAINIVLQYQEEGEVLKLLSVIREKQKYLGRILYHIEMRCLNKNYIISISVYRYFGKWKVFEMKRVLVS